MMFSQKLEHTLNIAFDHAKVHQHEFVTIEHLFLAMLEDEKTVEILVGCHVKLDKLRAALRHFVDKTTPAMDTEEGGETQPTLGFQRVLQRAIFYVSNEGKNQVELFHVLLAIFKEKSSQSYQLLHEEGIGRMDVLNYISGHTAAQISEEIKAIDNALDNKPAPEKAEKVAPAQSPHLDHYAQNLNAHVQQKGKDLDPLIGREYELDRIIHILSRRRKNNPLLIGEAGVGKTALVEGLAKRIVDGKVPDTLKDSVIYALDLGGLVAGTKYRGDFEKRLNQVLKDIKSMPHAIIFIDEIHTIVGAGAASGGTLDVANLIKPLLTSGEIRCMGATTFQEYRQVFSKDNALVRRFQNLEVVEPDAEKTLDILRGLRSYFESFHNLKYTDGAFQAAVALSARYFTDRRFPDKAIDLIDEAGAMQSTRNAKTKKTLIDQSDIELVVSMIARIPSQQISRSDRSLLATLEARIKSQVFGQDRAIETVSSAIKLSRSGLRSPDKPVGSFLFVGPTGVGKTEVAQQLSKEMGIPLIRFDMSEYKEAHSVSRLIGSPPGYVGHESGGLLTDAIKRNPHAVLLLDEIEKAHGDVYNLLLQVMDSGRLTDNSGVTTDFRHVVIIMTSNLGAQSAVRRSVGFIHQEHSDASYEAVRQTFSPEFRNRLDAVVQFNPLDLKTQRQVVNKFLNELRMQLKERNVQIQVSLEAKRWLSEHGYDEHMGARPLARLIDQMIKRPLADALLFGKLVHGGKAKVFVKDGTLRVDITS